MGSSRAYRNRKYEFGMLLHAYRTRLSLTQVEFAEQVGVHWRTVQNWETGEYYPKAEVLQQLISIFLHAQIFAPGNERAEALAFWQKALEDRPSTLASFDEVWFANLLAGSQARTMSTISTVAPPPAALSPAPSAPTARSHALLDWGEAMAAPALHGREAELATLHHWVMVERCRVVALVGLGGIGKSSLAITFAQRIASNVSGGADVEAVATNYEFVLFRSLQNAPPLAQVLDPIIQAISNQQTFPPDALADKVALLVQLFRRHRCLLILDNYETLFQPEAPAGTYRSGYADYTMLLRAMSEREHQSCLLLTSREKPIELGPLEGRTSPVRALRLGGLDDAACQSVLQAKEIFGTADEFEALARLYDGNPLALNLVSEPIRSLFGGDIAAFLETGHAFLGNVTHLMERQCARSSLPEKSLIFWLAIERENVPLAKLMANVGTTLSQRDLLTALESLRRRGQIERISDHPTFTLQPLILEFVSGQVMKFMLQEIIEGDFHFMLTHTLVQAHARDYVRHSQERLLLTPLLDQLLLHYGGPQPATRRLLALLDNWRGRPSVEQGYGPANVVHLLRLLRGDLRGLNLAHLSLREVYWQGVDAQDCDLTNAELRDNVFTETFGVVHTVAATLSGKYWAASSINGTVQVWRNEGQSLHLAFPAHIRHIKSLAFSPDEQLLATGSWDCTIKLWQTESGALVSLFKGHQDYVQDIAFSPDGRFLISGSDDQTICIWEVGTGQLLKTIHAHSDSVYGVAWSPTGTTMASCGADNLVRVWDVATGECVQMLAGHTRTVSKIAFSPDGRLLASGGYDRTLRIWEVVSGTCVKLFTGHESTVMALAWYDSGRNIVTCSYDGTIRLWNLNQAQAHRILLGHRASINSIAVTTNGAMLLSGSDDETVRVWGLENGLCLRVIEGYGLIPFSVAWSPDGRSLVSANSDTTLTLWDAADGTVRRTLRGHTHTVYGVSWSPDGLWLASNGFDQTLHIWDAQSGESLRVFSLSTDALNRMAKWSPHGRWLAGPGRDRTVRVWDINTGMARWEGRGHAGAIHDVVWSPDGKRLASCSEDHTIRIWQAEDGALLHTLAGHESSVAGIAWNPDGRYLASCGGGGGYAELFLWDTQSGAQVKTFVGHSSMVWRVAWSQDGKQLYSGGITGMIRWWDVESRKKLHSQQGHQNWIRSLEVSPDGTTLVSSGEDGVIRLWDIATATLLRTLHLDRPYERMNLREASGLTTAQRTALITLGALP